MKSVYLAAIVVLVAAGSAFGQQSTITVAQAESLVRLVLRHEGIKLSSRYCEVALLRTKDGKAFVPDYYSFGASCDYPDAAATTPFGIYVVSPRTGEVWEFNECTRFAFPELSKLRRKLVPQNEASEKAEAKYRVNLGCEQEPAPARN